MNTTSLDRPIFILGAHKSGSSLVRALLDGHPDLCVLPLESHFLAHLNWWIQYPLRSNIPSMEESSDFTGKCLEWITFCNTLEDRYADSQMAGKIDTNEFKKSLKFSKQGNSESYKVIQYFEALSNAVFAKGINSKRVVEKSVEHTEHALGISRLFPGSIFIHIIRNPYANLVTLRKYFELMGRHYPLLGQIIRSLTLTFYHARRNPLYVPNYHILRYEDLVENPEYWIFEITKWLDISDNSILRIPTAMGHEWQGNSISDSEFKGISSSRVDQWKKDINPLEIALINKYLPQIVEEFNYEKVLNKGKPYFPQRKEWFKSYFTNRLVLRRG